MGRVVNLAIINPAAAAGLSVTFVRFLGGLLWAQKYGPFRGDI